METNQTKRSITKVIKTSSIISRNKKLKNHLSYKINKILE
jgi:hypothetical protein